MLISPFWLSTNNTFCLSFTTFTTHSLLFVNNFSPSTHSLFSLSLVHHYVHLLPTPPLTLTLFNILNSSLSHSHSFSSCTSLCLLTPHPTPPHPYLSHTVQHIVVSIWLSGSLTPFSLLASIGLMVICQKDLDMIRSISSIFSA